jgi:hypothetical protein
MGDHILRMLESDLSQGTTPGWIQVVGVGFLDVKGIGVEPVLSFSIALASMNVWWLVAFVGVEEESPTANEQDRRHAAILNQCPRSSSALVVAFSVHHPLYRRHYILKASASQLSSGSSG